MEMMSNMNYKLYWIVGLFFYSTTVFGFQERKVISDIIEIVAQKKVSAKEKEEQLITYLNSINHNFGESKIGFFYFVMGVEFDRNGLSESAIRFMEKSVKIKRKYKDSTPNILKKGLFNLGVLYNETNQKRKSIAAYQEILTIKGVDRYHGKAYRELALLHFGSGDVERILNYLEKAIQILNTTKDTKELYFAYSTRANFYRNIDLVKYKEQILADLKICDSLIPKIENEKKRLQYRSTINNSRGSFYSDIQEHQNAISFYKKALEQARSIKDTARILKFQNNLGLAFFKNKNYQKALRMYQHVLNNTERQNSRAIAYNNLGDYYTYKKDYEKAEEMYLNAIHVFVNSKNKIPTLEELELTLEKFDAKDYLEQTADFYYKKYTLTQDTVALKKSLSMIKLVDGLIDMIRLENKEHKSKLYWRTQGKDLYMKGVRVSQLLNRPYDAFYFMEKSKVLLLLEEITDEQAKELGGIPDEIAYRDRYFKNQINTITRTLSNAKESEKDSIKNVLFLYKRKHALFKDSIYDQFPVYAQMRKNIHIVNPNTFSQEKLTDSTAVVSYILDDRDGYGLLITREKTALFPIENTKELLAYASDLKQKTTAPFFSEDDFTSFNTIAHKVYKMLFGNIENELKGKNRLIIIPDESIATLPFETLQREATNEDPLQPTYLLHDMNISYNFSVSHLVALQKPDHRSSKRFVGIAPVNFEQKHLISLPDTEEEVSKINTLFSGNLLLHEQATKERSIKNIENHAIVHIASHASYEENDGSWLWFHDDKLTFAELHSLQNSSDLVVLNACKTLQGNKVQGEGIMSLSRGFFASGAKSVVASLWNSNDRSSQEIITSFYEQLKNKRSKDEALSFAKRAYVRSHHGSETSPYYWASITITGDASPVNLNPKSYLIYFIFLGVALAIILLINSGLLKSKDSIRKGF